MSLSDIVTRQLKKELNEKSKSKAQRHLMGWVHACQKGEASSCPSRVKKIGKSMSNSETRKFAKTKEKGLPEKKHPEKDIRNEATEDDSKYRDWTPHDPRWAVNEPAKRTGGLRGITAWTGGSAPPPYEDMDFRTQRLVHELFADQLYEYGGEPDEDTRKIFWNRAMHDAWATMRRSIGEQGDDDEPEDDDIEPGSPEENLWPGDEDWYRDRMDLGDDEPVGEALTLADLDTQGILKGLLEQDLATTPNKDARPDSEWVPRLEDQPDDAGDPQWHEPKAEWESIRHRDSMHGLIKQTLNPDMEDQAYKHPDPSRKLGKPQIKNVRYNETIRVEHPLKGKGTVLSLGEGRAVVEWDRLNLRPLGPEVLTKEQASFVSVIREEYATDPEEAEMPPRTRKRKDKKEVVEDRYKELPSVQIAPSPSTTIFQDQETDEDWDPEPLATQRGADAAPKGDAPDGEMEDPDDAPGDLDVDQQEIPNSGRAEKIAGRVFRAFSGADGDHSEIDYKSAQAGYERQNDDSQNRIDRGSAESSEKERDNEEARRKKAEESLSLADFDVEGILD